MGKCIFCGFEGKLTREHIWADWLRAYIPKDMTSYEAGKVTVNMPGISDKVAAKKIAGDPHSRRVKYVCGTCNSGWMSQLQERAKPVVIPLIEGRGLKLSQRQQKTLAAWIAMAVMCSEFGDRTRIAIPQHDRDILYRHHVPPVANWRIWVAGYKTTERVPRWDHRVLTIVPEKEVDQAAFAAAPFYNTQSTTESGNSLYTPLAPRGASVSSGTDLLFPATFSSRFGRRELRGSFGRPPVFWLTKRPAGSPLDFLMRFAALEPRE